MSEDEIDRNEFWVLANAAVRASKKPNYAGERIQVNNNWNFEYLEAHTTKLPEAKATIEMCKYGWPLNAEDTKTQSTLPPNAKGARDNTSELNQYIEKEIRRGSIIGPFHTSPFGDATRISPLDTRPKKDSDDLRVILNLSHPFKAGSVNASISKIKYLGVEFKLHYPTCDDLGSIVRRKGKGCKIFKRDVEACYKQMYMDPGDIHLLGFRVGQYIYFDVTLSMGARSSCLCCQRTTNLITHIFCDGMGGDAVNYLDDFGGAEEAHKAEVAFLNLGRILQNIGIHESKKKACPPSHTCTFLGVKYDTINMVMTISDDRITELQSMLEQWSHKTHASLKEVQQILGKLNFVCNTVRSGRVFVSRIINLLKELPTEGQTPLSEEFKADLRWWQKYMSVFDGRNIIPDYNWAAPDTVISTDATPTTCGGWADGEYWHSHFPEHISNMEGVYINELESLAVIVGMKVWKDKISNRNVLMYCDNKTTVDILNSGKASNPFAQKCLREACYITARCNAVVKVVFKPGVKNREADLCSRIDLSSKDRARFVEEFKDKNLTERFVYNGLFDFQHDW